ncbi:MAG: hypothetical protein A3I61_19840 [Acidobacteria bacterium RIFCSPLOWO2_02_FULL_68_18]|nr:MAG: hypothetical protein A3I61_19840 [Acidobacteria bacterium RIFCSPLOWO2_02_FULL_68_18]OFW48284.1 MAG: hypothetical protein A3G77_03295 [Acidobacteria bacterium RIFCSPLOWO2_12_FULL_68_19]
MRRFVRLHYLPLVRMVYRKRLQTSRGLMRGVTPFRRALEVGFGPGFLLPALAHYAQKVVAVDIHHESGRVAAMLDRQRVTGVLLMRNSITALAFRDASFDFVISTSVLEHIHALDAAVRELSRVVRPGGSLVLGFPMKNRLTDTLFKMVGFAVDEHHPNSHADIIAALGRTFRIRHQSHLPNWLPLDFALYGWVLCEKPKQ